MEPSEGDKYVDHKETVISASRPRQLNARKVDITPQERVQSSEAGHGSVLAEFQVSVLSKTEELKSCEDGHNVQGATSSPTALKGESTNGDKVRVSVEKSIFVQGSSSAKSKESSSTKTVKKYATTIYTQRISGRKSRSSDSDSDISSPTTKPSMKAPLFGSTASTEAHSPTEISSVQFKVEAGVASSTTTALSKMFTKTVETTTEVSKKERHLSECSISIGGPRKKQNGQQLDLDNSTDNSSTANEHLSHEAETQERMNDDTVFTEACTSVKSDEEKEVAEYCPGLAIRTLTLEDLQEKRLSPARDEELSSTPILKSTEMSTTMLASQSSAASQEKGFFSSYADSACKNISMPVERSQEGMLSSEHSTSQLLASESSTSMTTSSQSSSLTSGGQVLMQCSDDLSTSLRKPLFNPIEVERKFTMNENTEERLRSLGARLHKEKMFTDVYYDNEEFALIVADCWLRRRNDCWEAKVPRKTQKSDAVFSPASQYKEISGEREISTWLVDQLGLETWMRGDPIDLLVQAAGLTEFTKFITRRRSYTLPSCMVDLHLTDNGFKVGEIDVMAASPEDLPQALQTISNMAEQLGTTTNRNQRPEQPALCILFFICHVFNNIVIGSTADSSVT